MLLKMVFYCCVPLCTNSGYSENVSLHKFPKDEKEIRVWKERIRRSGTSATKDYFKVSEYSRVCSEHFLIQDFFYFETKHRRLRPKAVPSLFSWNTTPRRMSPRKRRRTDSETDSASEGEDRAHADVHADRPLPCTHQFSVDYIKKSNPKLNLMKFYTGFQNYEVFSVVLELIVPEKDRSNIVYCDRRNVKLYTSGVDHFDSDDENDGTEGDEDDNDDENDTGPPSRTHKLTVEDEFLLTLMKLKLGLFNKDLSVRFQVSTSTVTKITKTWINLMFLRLGTLKLFPHRDIIVQNMTTDFKRQYPRTMVIIDCTELKIEMSSSLVRKTQTYSNYKQTNTFKGLVGVDCRGGIMFVSHLYTGEISDKKICERSGFFDLLKSKMATGELLKGDAVMADKGFTISEELKEIGLRLNVPPFLGKQKKFQAKEVLETQMNAHHRIHVERAIGKVRNFHTFDNMFPIKSAGLINQIWTVCCLLSNFQDPLINSASETID